MDTCNAQWYSSVAEGLASQLERLTDAYLNGVMPLAEYQRRRAAVQQPMQTMQRQLNQLEVDAQRHRNLAGLTQSVEAFCRRLQGGLEQATVEQKRQLVELLIDRVVVTNDDVEIRSVIPTTPSSEHVRFCHLRTDYFDTFVRIVAADTGRFLHGLDGLGIHDGSTRVGIPAQPLTFRVVQRCEQHRLSSAQAKKEEVRQRLHCSASTLDRWHKTRLLVPCDQSMVGSKRRWHYRSQDVATFAERFITAKEAAFLLGCNQLTRCAGFHEATTRVRCKGGWLRSMSDRERPVALVVAAQC